MDHAAVHTNQGRFVPRELEREVGFMRLLEAPSKRQIDILTVFITGGNQNRAS